MGEELKPERCRYALLGGSFFFSSRGARVQHPHMFTLQKRDCGRLGSSLFAPNPPELVFFNSYILVASQLQMHCFRGSNYPPVDPFGGGETKDVVS